MREITLTVEYEPQLLITRTLKAHDDARKQPIESFLLLKLPPDVTWAMGRRKKGSSPALWDSES